MLSLEQSLPILGLTTAKLGPLGPCTAGDFPAAAAVLSPCGPTTAAASPISSFGLDQHQNMYVVQMLQDCGSLTGIPCVGLAGGAAFCCACYQGFPAASAPAPPCTAVATAPVPTVTALTTPYGQQSLATATLPQQPTNGAATFHPSPIGGVATRQQFAAGGPSLGRPTLRPGYQQQQQPQQQHHNHHHQPQSQQQPQQQSNGASSPGFPHHTSHSHNKYRPRYHNRSPLSHHHFSSSRFAGHKRKAPDDCLSTDSADSGNGSRSSSSSSSSSSECSGSELFTQPLYCKICRVTLNAPAQAKQHYEGKNHAKKVKLTDCPANNSNLDTTTNPASSTTNSNNPSPSASTTTTTGNEQDGGASSTTTSTSDESPGATTPTSEATTPGSTTPTAGSAPGTSTATVSGSGATTSSASTSSGSGSGAATTEINPQIYCKICGVSFNSDKQAHQHYQGKNHAKKVRATDSAAATGDGRPPRPPHRRGSRFRCYLCNLHLGSKEHLLSHLRGPRHQEKVKQQKATGGATGPTEGARRWTAAHNNNNSSNNNNKDTVGIPFAGPLMGGYHATSGGARGGTTFLGGPRRHTHGGHRGGRPGFTSSGATSACRRSVASSMFSMYRTPSGKFYCPLCNVTVDTDGLFSQHLDSRKHKMSNASSRHGNAASPGNNNNNNNKSPPLLMQLAPSAAAAVALVDDATALVKADEVLIS